MSDAVISRRALLRGGAALGATTLAAGSALAGHAAHKAAEGSDDPSLANAIKDQCGGDALGTALSADYSDAQWEQLFGSLDDYLNRIRQRRSKAAHENADAPALTFDPRLHGRAYQLQPPERRESALLEIDAGLISMPDADEDIAFAPILVQGAMLREGRITSVRLTEIYLDRIAKYSKKLNNFVTVTKTLALEQAKKADDALAIGKDYGPLHGIPYVVKDLADTKGILTTWGAAPYKDRIAQDDAEIVAKLADAGAVLLGKTTMGALAYADLWFGGVTRNPWAPDEGSSGSSAGSASATASGLCSFSIGTETLGSIVSPSARTGCVGLRPSFGRVSRAGAMALCWSLDKIGPITRTVDDANLVLEAINGFDARDASSIDTGYDAKAAQAPSNRPEKIKVGFDPNWFKDNATDTDCKGLATLKKLGYEMVEISLPDLPIRPLLTQLEVEAAAAFEELTLEDRDTLLTWQADNARPNAFRAARLHTAIELIQIDRLRRKWMAVMGALFDKVDVVAGPDFAGGMLFVTNYTGHPSITLPLAMEERALRPLTGVEGAKPGPKTKMPKTFSLWGDLFREDQLVSVAAKLEAEFKFADQRPDASLWL